MGTGRRWVEGCVLETGTPQGWAVLFWRTKAVGLSSLLMGQSASSAPPQLGLGPALMFTHPGLWWGEVSLSSCGSMPLHVGL